MTKQVEFKKTIGLPQLIALNIGAVLGSGILLVPGIAAKMAGPSSLLAWALMSLLVFPMALVMGLLAAKYPSAGGVSTFVTNAFGPKAGGLVGWFFLMSVVIGVPIVALTGSGYLAAAFNWNSTIRMMIAVAMLLIGMIINFVGMKTAAFVQILVVIAIVAILIFAIIGSIPNIKLINLHPIIPTNAVGWLHTGQAVTLLYWCFIGWEAITHLSAEFKDPKREVVRGVLWSAFLVSILYFLTALATVGTNSYRGLGTEVSLSLVVEKILGPMGSLVIGITAIFICMGGIIAYVGAASRLAYSLSSNGDAPKVLGILSKKYNTPIGGLTFLAIFFIIILGLYATGTVSISTIIQFPNATFVLTYLGGCAAGIKLLKDSKLGLTVSWLSSIMTAMVFPFVGWVAIYPLFIIFVFLFMKRDKKVSSNETLHQN